MKNEICWKSPIKIPHFASLTNSKELVIWNINREKSRTNTSKTIYFHCNMKGNLQYNNNLWTLAKLTRTLGCWTRTKSIAKAPIWGYFNKVRMDLGYLRAWTVGTQENNFKIGEGRRKWEKKMDIGSIEVRGGDWRATVAYQLFVDIISLQDHAATNLVPI